jgi:hypothetical protein
VRLDAAAAADFIPHDPHLRGVRRLVERLDVDGRAVTDGMSSTISVISGVGNARGDARDVAQNRPDALGRRSDLEAVRDDHDTVEADARAL